MVQEFPHDHWLALSGGDLGVLPVSSKMCQAGDNQAKSCVMWTRLTAFTVTNIRSQSVVSQLFSSYRISTSNSWQGVWSAWEISEGQTLILGCSPTFTCQSVFHLARNTLNLVRFRSICLVIVSFFRLVWQLTFTLCVGSHRQNKITWNVGCWPSFLLLWKQVYSLLLDVWF